MSNKKYAQNAANAMSQLYVFSSVISILEGGNLTGNNASSSRIIKICQKEAQKQLQIYDENIAQVKDKP